MKTLQRASANATVCSVNYVYDISFPSTTTHSSKFSGTQTIPENPKQSTPKELLRRELKQQKSGIAAIEWT